MPTYLLSGAGFVKAGIAAVHKSDAPLELGVIVRILRNKLVTLVDKQ
jgi:hypothetical protein